MRSRKHPTMSLRQRRDRAVHWLREVGALWWRVVRLTYLRAGHGMSAMIAAAIAFYALICVGPLAILAASALQPILGPGGRNYEWLQYMVSRAAGEASSDVMREIDAVVTHPGAYTAGAVSVAMLMWAGLRLFEALERGLTEIWPGDARRGFVTRKLMALAGMAVAGVLLVAAIVMNALLPSAIAWLNRLPMIDTSGVLLLQPRMRTLIEVGLTFIAFFLVLKFIPPQAVATKVAAVGALFTTVVWKAVVPVFTLIIARSAEHSTIYGGLAGVVMFLTWALFGARVLLLGAHFAATFAHVFCTARPPGADAAFVAMRGDPDGDASDRGE